MARIRVGISGWTYEGWRESFYPKHIKAKDELSYASEKFHAIEVNGTFHSLFRPKNFLTWSNQTPNGFIFAIKGPKYLTHIRRLKDFESPLSNFLASGVLALGKKLGPILWQFPPFLPFSKERFLPFMKSLPRTLGEASYLAKGYSTWLEGRTFLDLSRDLKNYPMRHAIEGRHPSFKSEEFIMMARETGVAVVIGDTAGRWPYIEDITSDFLYIRLHADESKYPKGYTKKSLQYWAQRCGQWANGIEPEGAKNLLPPKITSEKIKKDVFVFFDNDIKELAPVNALSMIDALVLNKLITRSQEIPEFEDLEDQVFKQIKKTRTTKLKPRSA